MKKQLMTALLLTTVLLTSCAQSQDTIKVGAILTLSGSDYTIVGQEMQRGIQLAVEEANKNGGINGTPVEVIFEDAQISNKKASKAANKLIHRDNVVASLVSHHSMIMTIGPTFEKTKTPALNLWDTNDKIEGLGDYVFSTGLWTNSAGRRIAEYAYENQDVRTVSIISQPNKWSKTVTKYFKKEFRKHGGEIVFEEYPPNDEKDYRSVITKAKAANPDAIFAPLGWHLGIFFKQLKESGYNGIKLSSDALTQDHIDASEGGTEDLYYTNFYVNKSRDKVQKLQHRYKQRYGEEPAQFLFVGLGYDGMKTIIAGLRKGGTTREKLKEGLYQVKDVPGAFSNISINNKGSYRKVESILQVRNETSHLVQK